MSAKFNVKLVLDKVEYTNSGGNIGNQWEFITKFSANLPSPITGNESDFNATQSTSTNISKGQTKNLNFSLINAQVESDFSHILWPIAIEVIASEKDLGKDDVGIGNGVIIAAVDSEAYNSEVVVSVDVKEQGVFGGGKVATLNFTFNITSASIGKPVLQGDKYHTVLAMATARAWKDPSYRKNLVANPNDVIKEEGLSFPDNVKFVILEDTPTVRYFNVTRNLDLNKDSYQFIKLMEKVLPIPEGTELRMVQSTENTRYLVIPQLPDNVDASATPDADLVGIASAQGSSANVTETVNVTTAVNVQTAAQVTTAVTTAEEAVAAVAVIVAT